MYYELYKTLSPQHSSNFINIRGELYSIYNINHNHDTYNDYMRDFITLWTAVASSIAVEVFTNITTWGIGSKRGVLKWWPQCYHGQVIVMRNYMWKDGIVTWAWSCSAENIVTHLNVMWENCRFSTETFWRLVFSHEWFIIHLQRDEVELEMNSEPRVWEHQSPKCWVGELCSLPPHYCEI